MSLNSKLKGSFKVTAAALSFLDDIMHIYGKDFHALRAEQRTDVPIKAFKSYVSRKVQITNIFSFTYSESMVRLTFNLLCFLHLSPFSPCDSMSILFQNSTCPQFPPVI